MANAKTYQKGSEEIAAAFRRIFLSCTRSSEIDPEQTKEHMEHVREILRYRLPPRFLTFLTTCWEC